MKGAKPPHDKRRIDKLLVITKVTYEISNDIDKKYHIWNNQGFP